MTADGAFGTVFLLVGVAFDTGVIPDGWCAPVLFAFSVVFFAFEVRAKRGGD